MKPELMIVAGLLALSLSACGGGSDQPAAQKSAEAKQAQGEHADEASDSHEHAEGEAGHGEQSEVESTVIRTEIARRSGIGVAAVGAGTIADEHEVQGLLTPLEGRVARITARYPGPVRSLRANVGDRVSAGQTLATIDSNLSLTTYSIAAPISGVVLARNASVGEVAVEGMALFEIADLSSLWVDLHVFGEDATHLRPGLPVTVMRMGDDSGVETTLDRILPGTATASQSTVARASIKNADGLWRPGSAVRARVTVEQLPVELAVPLTALQRMDDGDVVFVREGERYSARPVKLGRRDARRVQVLSGLKAGEQVVIEQSFLIKADIEKAGASHEH
ncbi:efflux RND transporter periplasmic adaptor subunit [Lysobacter capsici]|uniref:efflux RND transporter periplasmic adaptor subunit n=1 Tax=Lysobacter capsici TaxID=435897 RepID=UPI00287BA04F|nr:efflux RND transporter periplasmic adaptor subunit [Lysobacter capsici]WND79898.1 efflux RND transporter periplasmic adaptor subunit [Lysobacter capsici]WND85095.1 efflux RND transporter periplasmic adaptor subunit [Lysobacter capsici]